MALLQKPRTSLAGRSVLITGAARGIGTELARRAATRGAHVVLVGLEPALLEKLAAELGPEHLWVEADVTDPDALAAAVPAPSRPSGDSTSPSPTRGSRP
jgi:NAD(P)-dependent dehydrogenase (short-subunit alcohol dehydrogenase family)